MRLLSVRAKSSGFTLVEILVVAPVVILVIGTIIAVSVNLIGSGLRTQARAQLQEDVLLGLSRFEQDIQLSVDINYQGGTQFDFDVYATDRNPLDPERKVIDAASCSVVSGGSAQGDILKYWVAYWYPSPNNFERYSTFNNGCATSTVPWQKAGSEPVVRDAIVSTVYTYDEKGAVTIELTAKRKVAGQEISYTGKMYAKSLNVKK